MICSRCGCHGRDYRIWCLDDAPRGVSSQFGWVANFLRAIKPKRVEHKPKNVMLVVLHAGKQVSDVLIDATSSYHR
jgi:hypothetical protein